MSVTGGHSKEFVDLIKAIGESKSKQEEDAIVTRVRCRCCWGAHAAALSALLSLSRCSAALLLLLLCWRDCL